VGESYCFVTNLVFTLYRYWQLQLLANTSHVWVTVHVHLNG